MDTPSRLVWEDVVIGTGARGYLPQPVSGRILIATISWGSQRNDAKPWKLYTTLPGYVKPRSFETIEAAKASAERILQNFVTMVIAAGDFPA